MKISIAHDLYELLKDEYGFSGAQIYIHFPLHTIRFSTVHSAAIYHLWQYAVGDEQGQEGRYETLGSNPGGYPSPRLPLPREAVARMAYSYLNPLQAELWSYEFAERVNTLIGELEDWRGAKPDSRSYYLDKNMTAHCEAFAQHFTDSCANVAEELSKWSLLPGTRSSGPNG